MTRLPRLTYAGVFLIAASVILLQIALTRVFAIMLWHHLTYMVVSIALLGFGASGSILTTWRRKSEHPPFGLLAGFSVAYGLSVVVAFGGMRFVEIDSLKLWEDKGNLVALFVLYSITAVPFLLAGMALGTALTCFVKHVNKLYFVDLLGSGFGGALSVLILMTFGGTTTIMLAAAVGCLAGFLFGFAASKAHRISAAIGLGIGTIVFVSFATGMVEWHPPFAAGKVGFAGEDLSKFDRIYSATAEVEIGPEQESAPAHGGNVGLEAKRPMKVRGVGQDGTAPTLLIKDAGKYATQEFITKVQSASGHVCYKARGAKDADVLVIGVGGGVDVMVAIAAGAKSVTAAEINTAMVEMVTERYDDYLGGLFRPGAHAYSDKIKLVNAEGRSFVRTSDANYDIIQMSGVDSFTALSTGAYTLSEAYLYTIEAVKEFYGHLKDGGYINYSRFLLSHPKKPRETLRLANIAVTALEQLGVANAKSHLVVFQGQDWASTMIKKGPFTRVEIDALKAFANKQGFLGLLFDPLRKPGETPVAEVPYLDLSSDLDGYLAHRVATFFPTFSAAQHAVVAAKARELYPAILRGDQPVAMQAAKDLATALGDPAAEKAAINLFGDIYLASVSPAKENFTATAKTFHGLLDGDATERQKFMDDYPFDVSACIDDKPFFFNYYRYEQVWKALFDPDASSKSMASYFPDVPVGHVVLFASMAQITLLALILIFLPLIRLRLGGVKTKGTWRFFLYFAALGMGFMFVEIVLMQKMVIFLGHPIYAVSVVLTSLLICAGLGSLLAGRFGPATPAGMKKLMFAIVTLIVVVCLLMNYVMPLLLGYSLAVRIAAVALLIAPMGLLLGMPFPTGMRIAEQSCPDLLPWCWAINGFLSVFSSVFCIVMSMVVGFSVVLLASAAVYAVGFLALLPKAADRAPA